MFQFHSICSCLLVRAAFNFLCVPQIKVLTEILHGEFVVVAVEVADAPTEVVVVMPIPILLISIITAALIKSVSRWIRQLVDMRTKSLDVAGYVNHKRHLLLQKGMFEDSFSGMLPRWFGMYQQSWLFLTVRPEFLLDL